MKENNYSLNSLETILEEYLVKRAPALPERLKNILVSFIPWLTLILLVITLPVILAFFGISLFLLPFSFLAGAEKGANYTVSLIFSAVIILLEALAIPGLFKKTKQGWNLLFYASLLNAVYELVTLNFFGLIIGTLLSLYLLFQIRPHYK